MYQPILDGSAAVLPQLLCLSHDVTVASVTVCPQVPQPWGRGYECVASGEAPAHHTRTLHATHGCPYSPGGGVVRRHPSKHP